MSLQMSTATARTIARRVAASVATNAPTALPTNFKTERTPWQAEPLDNQDNILLLTGSAGGGKSHLAAEMVHRFLWRNPGATGLMLRKAREFASKSIVPFFWHSVLERNSDVAKLKKSETRFEYAGGSVLHWGGMKDDGQREALRSIGQEGGLDIVWIEEANAFSWLDFQEILGRMRGTAGDYRQIILTTNPDAPTHWINERLIIGGLAKVFYSHAIDNPYNPDDYIEALNLMTGVQRERLVLGKWVQAEGVIYDNFEPEHNVTVEAEYNPDLPVIWGVDDGYARGDGPGNANYHPRVILFGQMTAIGGINIFKEYYMTQELSEVTIANALALPYQHPDVAYVDSSAAELKGRIHAAGIQTIGATHKVTEGIKNFRRLVCDGQGVRLLKIHPRCTEFIREMQSYRYDIGSRVAVVGEGKPLAIDDHGPSTGRYMTWHLRMDRNYGTG